MGWLGVDLFFCLSAFLLTRLLSLEQEETGSIHIVNFFIRRMLRIWPLYFTYVSIAILFSCYHGIITNENWFRVAGLLTFSDNIFASLHGYNPILFTGHLWTISYEEQFYLLLPFIIQYLAKQNAFKIHLVLGMCFLIGILIRLLFIYAQLKHPAIWVLPPTHFESILLGILVGLPQVKADKIDSRIYFLSALISIIGILLLPDINIISYHLMVLYLCIGIASCSILCFFLYNDRFKTILQNRAFVFLGKISFGLYVFHSFCINVIGYLLKEEHFTMITFVLSLVFTVVIAAVSYLFLEIPFLKIKKKFTIVSSRSV